MTTINLSPIPLLPHEARHAATHDSGLLWRAIEPEPEEAGQIHSVPDALRWNGAQGDRGTIERYMTSHAPYQSGHCYYVQEPLHYDIEQGAFYATPVSPSLGYPNGMKPAPVPDDWEWNEEVSDVPAESMPIEAARAIIEITKVEVRRSWDLGRGDYLAAGVPRTSSLPAKDFRKMNHLSVEFDVDPWGFLYHYIVKERR